MLSWLRARLRPPTGPISASISGEIALGGDDQTWTLKADLRLATTASAWLLVEGPDYRQVQVCAATTPPLVFSLPAGRPGTYRFWLVASRLRRLTAEALARRARKAMAAGEFHVEARP